MGLEDYQRLVREIYPDAFCEAVPMRSPRFVIWEWDTGYALGRGRTERTAWRDALREILINAEPVREKRRSA